MGTNFANIALFASISFGFFRVFLINISDNRELEYIASFGFYLLPFVFIIAYGISKRKGYLIIINKANKNDERRVRREQPSQRIIIEEIINSIMESNLPGVKIQHFKILENKNGKINCEGIFHVDSGRGLFFVVILLAKVWQKHQIHFKKLNIINTNFYYESLEEVQNRYLMILEYAFMSSVFKNLIHFEIHNF